MISEKLRDVDEGRTEARIRLGLFDVEGIRFGVNILSVSEVSLAQELLPMVTANQNVIGALDLRSSIVPVLDPLALCSTKNRTTVPRFVVVLAHEGQRVGLAIDQTHGISEFASSSFQTLYSDPDGRQTVVRQNVLHDGKPVNILEVDRIFAQPDLPALNSADQGRNRGALDNRTAFLTFTAGGATFGVEATGVFSTVPRQTITPGPMAGSNCLGIIEHLGRKIPVISCSRCAGLGTELQSSDSEVVVLHFGEGRLIGFAVDVIRRIEFIRSSTLQTPSPFVPNAGRTINAVYFESDGTQVFILDASNLMQDDELQKLAKLSEPNTRKVRKEDDQELQDAKTDPVLNEEKRYLTFVSGTRWASVLTDIVSIIKYPERVTEHGAKNSAKLGFFTHNGKSVLLVDLRALNGAGPSTVSEKARVLLVTDGQSEVGFVVERVEGIEDSKRALLDQDGSTMVQMPSKRMVNVLSMRDKVNLLLDQN